MRPGRALSTLATPTSVVNQLFCKGNGQQEDATEMPVGERGLRDEESVDDAVMHKLYTLITCDARMTQLHAIMQPSLPSHHRQEPPFRSSPATIAVHAPVERPDKPWVDAELVRVNTLRMSTMESLHQHFHPDKLTDPIFRPYDDAATMEAHQQQSTPLEKGVSRMSIAEPALPSSTMDPSLLQDPSSL